MGLNSQSHSWRPTESCSQTDFFAINADVTGPSGQKGLPGGPGRPGTPDSQEDLVFSGAKGEPGSAGVGPPGSSGLKVQKCSTLEKTAKRKF